MTYEKVLTFFKKLPDENPPITDKLVKNGFKQVCDGYILEASKAVEAVTLGGLVEEIITSDQIHNRRFWNNRIKDVCWDKIKLKFNQK